MARVMQIIRSWVELNALTSPPATADRLALLPGFLWWITGALTLATVGLYAHSQGWQVLFAVAMFGALTLTVVAVLTPGQVLALWIPYIGATVLWPGDEQLWAEFAGIPLEYAVPILLLGCSLVAVLIRGVPMMASLSKYGAGFLAAFLAFVALSAGWAVDKVAVVQTLSMWVVYLGGFLGIAATISSLSPRARFWLLSGTAVSLVVLAGLGLARSLFYGSFADLPHYSAIIRYAHIEGYLLLFGGALSLCLAGSTKDRRWLVGAFVCMVGAACLFNRSTLVALLVTGALACAFLALRPEVTRRHLLIVTFLLGGTAVLAYLFLGPLLWERLAGIMKVFDIWTGQVARSDADYETQQWFQQGIQIFRDHPWVGTGAGNYLVYFDDPTVEAVRPRNFYVGHLAEYGIVGTTLFLAFLTTLTATILRLASRRSAFPWFTLAAVHLAAYVAFLGEEYVSTPYFWWVWGIMSGLSRDFPRFVAAAQSPAPLVVGAKGDSA